jgi:hypothetical protein
LAQLSVGISFLSRKAPRTSPEIVPALVEAFTAKSWTRPLRYYTGIIDAPKTPPRRPGVLKPKTVGDEVAGLLTSDALTSVTLQTSARNDDQFSTLTVETVVPPHYVFSKLFGYHHVGEGMDAWVADMLACAAAIGAEHGVVCVMNEDGAAAEVSFVARTRDGKSLHPFPDELDGMRRVEREIGTTYVRFPRWGTLYSKGHVDALGGLERIVERVEPAVVREMGGAIYVQLTEHVGGALGDAAAAKQKSFTELATPLLPTGSRA